MTGRPEPGPLPDEAARLVEAALDWARRSVPEGWAEGDCTGCPACRTVRAVHSGSPELTEKLTAAVTDVAAAASGLLRVLSEARGTGEGRAGTTSGTTSGADASKPGTSEPGAAGAGAGKPPSDGDGPGPTVQRIEVT